MNTLLLDRTVWDVCKDANGNIALASDPYSVLQDVSSAVRLFLGELWYNTAPGVPYFEAILGQPIAPQILKGRIEQAARTVPQVVSATVFLGRFQGRALSGQIQIVYTPTTGGPIIGQPAPGGNARAVLYFVGDNGGVLTFVGDNGGVVTFYGRG